MQACAQPVSPDVADASGGPLSPDTGAREPPRAILKHEGGPSARGSGRLDTGLSGHLRRTPDCEIAEKLFDSARSRP